MSGHYNTAEAYIDAPDPEDELNLAKVTSLESFRLARMAVQDEAQIELPEVQLDENGNPIELGESKSEPGPEPEPEPKQEPDHKPEGSPSMADDAILRRLCQHRVLTKAEEFDLGVRVQAGNAAKE